MFRGLVASRAALRLEVLALRHQPDQTRPSDEYAAELNDGVLGCVPSNASSCVRVKPRRLAARSVDRPHSGHTLITHSSFFAANLCVVIDASRMRIKSMVSRAACVKRAATPVAVGSLAVLTGACAAPSATPTAPAALTQTAAAVSISSVVASAELSPASGFVYHVAMHVSETTGKSGAKFSTVAVVFPDGRGAVAALSAPVNLAAGGGQDVNTFNVVDPNGTSAATQLSASVDFADDSGRVGVASSSAAPVALIQTFSLIGYVRDAATGQGIVGATMQITSGPNTGESTTTNQDSYYSFRSLRPGTFSIDVSASGYVDATPAMTLTANGELDVNLTAAAAASMSRSRDR
jgi:archaellin